MTFEKWWQENNSAIYQHGMLASPALIKSLFKEAWHDGYKVGYESPKILNPNKELKLYRSASDERLYNWGIRRPECGEDNEKRIKRISQKENNI